jgi:hypothetical protein
MPDIIPDLPAALDRRAPPAKTPSWRDVLKVHPAADMFPMMSQEELIELALLWQIYSRRFCLQIHFQQCGHRCGGG